MFLSPLWHESEVLVYQKHLFSPTKVPKILSKWWEICLTHCSSHVTPPQRQPQAGGVPTGSDDGVDQNGPHVAEKELVGHGVSCVQDDLWQQVKEEHRRVQCESLNFVCTPNHPAQNEAKADEQRALWDYVGHMVVGFDN